MKYSLILLDFFLSLQGLIGFSNPGKETWEFLLSYDYGGCKYNAEEE